MPILTGLIVDRVVPRGDQHLLLVLAAGCAGLVGFKLLALLVRSFLLLHLRTRLDARMTLAFLGAKTDIYRPNEVRSVLAPLLRLAQRHACALLILRHITKARASRSIYAGQGSIDFIAAARSVILAGSGRDDPTRHALVHIKSNLAATGPGLPLRRQLVLVPDRRPSRATRRPRVPSGNLAPFGTCWPSSSRPGGAVARRWPPADEKVTV